MGKSDVFISYKSEEVATAAFIKKRIEAAGVSCWMAPASIPGGSSYAREIPRAIRNCKVFVLVLSRLAQESNWVPRELDQAINANKVIMPFTIDDSQLKADFDFYLTNVQRYPAYQDQDEAMENMVRDICVVLGREYVKPEVRSVDSRPEEEAGTELAAVPSIPEAARVQDAPEEKAQPTEAKDHRQEPARPKAPRQEPVSPKASRQEPTVPKKDKKAKKDKKDKKKGPGLIIAAVAVLAVLAIILIGGGLGSNPKITIAGKEIAKDTGTVRLEGETITAEDVEKLGNMKKLTSLHLHSCSIKASDISAMFPSGLKHLELSDCKLTREQFSQIPFGSFPVYDLDLSGNKDLDSLDAILAQKAELVSLNISGTAIKDLSKLPSLENLRILAVDDLGLTDLNIVAGMTGLDTLSADGNQLTSLESLADLENLTSLHVNRNKLETLNGVEKMIRMTELEAAGNRIMNTRPMTNMTLLKKVDLTDNMLLDISELKKSESTLKHVLLGHNKLTSLAALGKGRQIKYLNVEGNRLTDIAPMETYTKLESCCLRDNMIKNAGPLEKLAACSYLDLSRNQIKKINLIGMAKIHIIKLTGNPLTDWKEPKNGIRYLGLGGIKEIPGDGFKSLKTDYLVISYSKNLTPDVFDGDQYMRVYVVDCPLDQQVSWDKAAPGTFEFITKDQIEEIDNQYTDGNV